MKRPFLYDSDKTHGAPSLNYDKAKHRHSKLPFFTL